MKSTGIIRRIDDLGRIVIPKDIRRQFCIHEGDPMELFIGNEGITFTKYDATKSVQSCLDTLCEVVGEEPELKNREELLLKVREMRDLLKRSKPDQTT